MDRIPCHPNIRAAFYSGCHLFAFKEYLDVFSTLSPHIDWSPGETSRDQVRDASEKSVRLERRVWSGMEPGWQRAI
jgi:hypothetical protein